MGKEKARAPRRTWAEKLSDFILVIYSFRHPDNTTPYKERAENAKKEGRTAARTYRRLKKKEEQEAA